MQDAETCRFIGGQQPRALAWRGFLTMVGAWHIQGFAMFSVLEKATGAWVGRVGPWQPDGWPGPEVGYTIVRAAWGKGYAPEAAAAAMDWAFDHLGWTEVIHTHRPGEHALAAGGDQAWRDAIAVRADCRRRSRPTASTSGAKPASSGGHDAASSHEEGPLMDTVYGMTASGNCYKVQLLLRAT